MKSNMFLGADARLFKFAEELRSNETSAEKLLWERLRNKQLGVKFRRQHPLDLFVADFYCHQHKLVIELDGSIHLEKQNQEYDIMRSDFLMEHGLRVVRFTNQQVVNNTDEVLGVIRKIINS